MRPLCAASTGGKIRKWLQGLKRNAMMARCCWLLDCVRICVCLLVCLLVYLGGGFSLGRSEWGGGGLKWQTAKLPAT